MGSRVWLKLYSASWSGPRKLWSLFVNFLSRVVLRASFNPLLISNPSCIVVESDRAVSRSEGLDQSDGIFNKFNFLPWHRTTVINHKSSSHWSSRLHLFEGRQHLCLFQLGHRSLSFYFNINPNTFALFLHSFDQNLIIVDFFLYFLLNLVSPTPLMFQLQSTELVLWTGILWICTLFAWVYGLFTWFVFSIGKGICCCCCRWGGGICFFIVGFHHWADDRYFGHRKI